MMKRFYKIPVMVMVLVLMLCGTLAADFTIKTKTTTTMPMMGNMETDATYMIKADKIASVINTNSPMMAQMGQDAGQSMRTILRKGGKELIMVNYADSTYYIMDEKLIDSMGQVIKTLGGMIDSLKQMMTINKMEAKMTGNKKKVGEMKAEEFSINIDMIMKVAMMGPEPTAMPMKVFGNQWGTKDFPEHGAYSGMMNNVSSMMMGGGSGGGFSAMLPFLEALGMDKATIDQAMEFAQYIPIEGTMTISMEIPGMPMNIQVNTALIESSNAAIPDSEFEIPKGFEMVEPDLEMGGSGGLGGFPGMGN